MLGKYHSAEVDSVEMPAEGDYGIEYHQLPVYIRARSPTQAKWSIVIAMMAMTFKVLLLSPFAIIISGVYYFFLTGSQVRLIPSFLNIFLSTSESITVACT